jgi:hypothetical protein
VKTPLWITLLFLLAGCASFAAPDAPATLRAQNDALLQEATAIYQTAQARQGMVVATAFAAETMVVQRNNVNQQLLGTVIAAIPPTQQVVSIDPVGTYYHPIPEDLGDIQIAAATAPPDGVATPAAPDEASAGGDSFADTVTARAIRSSDGCAESSASAFTTDDDRVYVVTRAVAVSAGTRIDVEWQLDGQVASSGSWTVPQDESNFCIWFYLDSFSAGSWSVQLTANGTPITPAPTFTVSGPDAAASG